MVQIAVDLMDAVRNFSWFFSVNPSNSGTVTPCLLHSVHPRL